MIFISFLGRCFFEHRVKYLKELIAEMPKRLVTPWIRRVESIFDLVITELLQRARRVFPRSDACWKEKRRGGERDENESLALLKLNAF